MVAQRPSKKKHHLVTDKELNLLPVVNIVMIIIPFLLLTAVFAKTAIIDIYLPQENEAAQQKSQKNQPPPLLLTIKVNEKGFELGGIGKKITIVRKEGKFDYPGLNKALVKLKDEYPEKEDAILLFDTREPYDTVVKVMDATRETIERPRQPLFPLVSLGEDR